MTPLLSVKNLSKNFGSFQAIQDINFQTYPGEIFGLLGPNGAGKTTTIRLIAGSLTPDEGEIRVNNFSPQKEPLNLRREIGILTTDSGVYPRFTGRENLNYFGQLFGLEPQTLKERIKNISQILHMEDFLDRRAGKYSTGMKQKLSLARTIIHNPSLLIFDEPTAGLDVLASQTVINFMKKSRDEGKCVLLCTHRLNIAEKICDRVAIIHQGKIITTGNVSEIRKDYPDLTEAFLSEISKIPSQKRLRESPPQKNIDKKKIMRTVLIVLIVLIQFWLIKKS